MTIADLFSDLLACFSSSFSLDTTFEEDMPPGEQTVDEVVAVNNPYNPHSDLPRPMVFIPGLRRTLQLPSGPFTRGNGIPPGYSCFHLRPLYHPVWPNIPTRKLLCSFWEQSKTLFANEPGTQAWIYTESINFLYDQAHEDAVCENGIGVGFTDTQLSRVALMKKSLGERLIDFDFCGALLDGTYFHPSVTYVVLPNHMSVIPSFPFLLFTSCPQLRYSADDFISRYPVATQIEEPLPVENDSVSDGEIFLSLLSFV
jgi:hypothetical protein